MAKSEDAVAGGPDAGTVSQQPRNPLPQRVSGGAAVEGAISTYTGTPVFGEGNDIKVFAGPRDDPFFFDLNQYKAIIAGTATSFNNPGTDTFKGTNVMSLVIELPKSKLGAGPINIWATSNRKM